LKIEGVESGLDAVTLDGAIIDADVPRGMSYKIWQDENRTPQDAFRRATVIDLLSIPATAGLPATRELTHDFFEEHRDTLANGSVERRKKLLDEAIRRIGGFNYASLADSGNWKLYTALRSAAITRPEVDPAIIEVLLAGEHYLINQYCSLYQQIAEAFGLQLREGLTMEHFAAASYAVNEGLAQQMATTSLKTDIALTDSDGNDQDWTLFSIAFLAITDHFFKLKER